MQCVLGLIVRSGYTVFCLQDHLRVLTYHSAEERGVGWISTRLIFPFFPPSPSQWPLEWFRVARKSCEPRLTDVRTAIADTTSPGRVSKERALTQSLSDSGTWSEMPKACKVDCGSHWDCSCSLQKPEQTRIIMLVVNCCSQECSGVLLQTWHKGCI